MYFVEEKFNLSVEYCSNIENHTNEDIYGEVEKEVKTIHSSNLKLDSKYFQVVSFRNVIALTEHIIPILLSFYIGSWSDRFGRKPFLAFSMIGRTLGAVGNLISGIWLDEISRWGWLALYMPIQNISGGTLTFIMMTYSFIADNSTPRLEN